MVGLWGQSLPTPACSSLLPSYWDGQRAAAGPSRTWLSPAVEPVTTWTPVILRPERLLQAPLRWMEEEKAFVKDNLNLHAWIMT